MTVTTNALVSDHSQFAAPQMRQALMTVGQLLLRVQPLASSDLKLGDMLRSQGRGIM